MTGGRPAAMATRRAAILGLLLPLLCGAIHWPGFGHGEYAVGEVLPLRVAKLTSTRTQMPFSFFSLTQCMPQKLTASAENIGEVLHGDRIRNAPFELQLGRGAGLTYQRGYSLGAVDPQTGAVLVHNHLQFTIYFSAREGATAAGSVSGGGQTGERADESAKGGGTA